MAMISCPNCNEEISDKAKKCIHCGYSLVPAEKKICVECGSELNEEMTECPKCGCPVDSETKLEDSPQKVEVTGVKVTKKAKIIIASVIALIIVAVGIFYGVKQYQKVEAEKAHAEHLETYSANLELATFTMLSGASDAETCGNLIRKVWSNAIYEEKDDETDQYTRPDGYWVSDFNEALGNLFWDSSFISDIDSIESNQETVNALMKELKNPPEEYKDAYEAISDFYEAYLTLTNMAIDPTGNLQTYSSNFSDADTKTLNCYNALKLYLED